MNDRDELAPRDFQIPPTHFEIQQAQNELVTRQNAERERRRRRKACQRLGHDEAKPGDVLFVQPDGELKLGRTRAGIRFSPRIKTEVRVIAGTREDAAEERRRGAAVVSTDEADEIFEDGALHVSSTPATDQELTIERRRRIDAEELATAAQTEIDRLNGLLRQARARAEDTHDGRPNRLRAAEEVRAREGVPESGPDFGGPPAPELGDHRTHAHAPLTPAAPSATTPQDPAPRHTTTVDGPRGKHGHEPKK